MSELLPYAWLLIPAGLVAWVVAVHVRDDRRAVARARLGAQLQPGDDPRMIECAMFYGESIDQIRARIARGGTMSTVLGHWLIVPPAPPRPRPRYDPK